MLTATVDTSVLERKAATLHQRLQPALREAATMMQLAMAEELRAAMRSAGIQRRTGTMEDATREGGRGNISETTVDITGMRHVAGFEASVVPGWRLLDKGGTVVPKRAKFLAVPLHDDARALAKKAGGSLRNLGDVFFVMRTDEGKLLLADNDTGRPMFALLKKTVHKPRPYIDPAIEAYRAKRQPAIGERFTASVGELWDAS